jgi:probable HAF family extracellular repeat protein
MMMMLRRVRGSLILCVLALLAAPKLLAQGTYTQIDVPDAMQTNCNGINAAGEIVGVYQDSNFISHAFLLTGGVSTTIDRPGFPYTAAFGINDLGQIVGSNDPSDQAFIYDITTQTFTEIGYPGAGVTLPFAINNAGMIAGTASSGGREQTGFELVGSTYKVVAPPKTHNVNVTGITASGEVLGTVSALGGVKTFLYHQGAYTLLTIPGVSNPIVSGVNPSGTAFVGYYVPGSGGDEGFLYQAGSVENLNFPGSMYTLPAGINSAGMVVGTFLDSNLNTHGFLWTPPASPRKK